MPKKPDNINVSTKLGMFLASIKVMQLTLANEMGLPASTVGRYVAGISKTPQSVVDHLYKKHNLNLNWWYTGVGYKVRKAEPERKLVSDLGLLADKIEALSLRITEQDKVIKKLTADLYSKIYS